MIREAFCKIPAPDTGVPRHRQENARTAIDQSDYQQRYIVLTERHEKANERFEEVNKSIETRNAKRLELKMFVKMLEKREGLLTEFDDELWLATVNQLKVHSNKKFTFVLKDGSEMPWRILVL